MPDREKNRFSARAARYARVGANVGGVAARYAGRRLLGGEPNRAGEASALASALGNLKGPLMKVAQLMATIPDLLPPEYATELQKLQSEAPPMGWAFVKRRMNAELGPDWQSKFESFEHRPAAAASLGQVHRAISLGGDELACKLQYPDMQSAVEADLQQLQWLLAIRRRLDTAIDTTEIAKEIGARVREELDYRREAKHVALYRAMLDGIGNVRVPRAWPEVSSGRLLTLDWLDGTRMLAHKTDPLAARNALATAMFTAWWFPFSRFGVIHGDPHLGNYTVFEQGGEPKGINPPRRSRRARDAPGRARRMVLEALEFLFPSGAELRIHAPLDEGLAHGRGFALQLLQFGGGSRSGMVAISWATFISGPLRLPSADASADASLARFGSPPIIRRPAYRAATPPTFAPTRA